MEQVNRLEQALRVWEDICFLRRSMAIAQRSNGKPLTHPLEGPVAHSAGYRRDLLASGQDDLSWLEKYLMPAEAMTKAIGASFLSLPLELASWTAFSRRVFRLSPDLQALLNATSLDGVRWSDVPWPFQAFATSLDVPIKGADGMEYDLILIHGIGAADPEGNEVGVIQFRLLSTALERGPLGKFAKDGVENALRLRQWSKFDRRVKEAHAHLRKAKTSVFSLIEDKVADAPVTDAVHELLFRMHQRTCACGGTHPEWDQAVRLVVGLCLYLSTLPAKTPHRSPPRRLAKSSQLHPRAIANEAEICEVTSSHTLTTEERELFIGDGQHVGVQRELSAHWRRGHWRRPPGKGSDPMAPKVVHVRPTLVRRDRLPEGAVVAGSQTKIG